MEMHSAQESVAFRLGFEGGERLSQLLDELGQELRRCGVDDFEIEGSQLWRSALATSAGHRLARATRTVVTGSRWRSAGSGTPRGDHRRCIGAQTPDRAMT